MNINIVFCRELLRATTLEVLDVAPDTNLRDAWVWKAGPDHWEFHFRDYYWQGCASNAYEARAKGWAAWLAKRADNQEPRDPEGWEGGFAPNH